MQFHSQAAMRQHLNSLIDFKRDENSPIRLRSLIRLTGGVVAFIILIISILAALV